MTDTRTLRLAALSTVAALLAGCTTNEISTPAVLALEPQASPVFADTAQPVRDFPQSTSYIQNGDTVGSSTGFRYRSQDDINVGLAPLAEVGVFAANIVTLPYTLIDERGDRVSSGLQFPPSHTDMPRLPDPVTPANGQTNNNTSATPLITPDASSPTGPDATGPMAAPAAPSNAAPESEILSRAGTNQGAAAFTVAGQVQRPGTYDVRNIKLSQVVTAAGPGTTEPTKIRIQIDRPGEESATTTLDQLLSGAVEDVAVKAGDVITVGVLP